jgi:microcystin-dependent protein
MSQGSWQVPTGGTESAVTFAGQCNTAYAAIASMHSGATAPANGPGAAPVAYQQWMDLTSALFPVGRVYDGTNWNRLYTIDVAGHNVMPKLGGGIVTAASAATVDLGAQPQTQVIISGTTTVTSFGTTAAVGEMKFCYASGSFQLTNSSNLVLPGGGNIQTTAGDTWWSIYQGANQWIVVNYQRVAGGAGFALPTGSSFWRYGTGALAGCVRCNANTVGNTGSGGTEGTGAAYLNLYNFLWASSALSSTSGASILTLGSPGVVTWAGHGLQIGNPVVFNTTGALPTGLTAGTLYFVSATSFGANSFVVSDTAVHAFAGTNNINFTGSQSGTQTVTYVDQEIVISGTGRGNSSAADWAALKTISTPDLRGRSPMGVDRMGNSSAAAGRLTFTFVTQPDSLGWFIGSQSATLTTAQLPSHTHSFSGSGTTSGQSADHTHNPVPGQTIVITGASIGAGGNVGVSTISGNSNTSGTSNDHTHSVTISGTTGAQGSGSAVGILPPGKLVTWYMVL